MVAVLPRLTSIALRWSCQLHRNLRRGEGESCHAVAANDDRAAPIAEDEHGADEGIVLESFTDFVAGIVPRDSGD
jgi:hypothetical protein